MKTSEKNFFSTKGRINRKTLTGRSITIIAVFFAVVTHLALTDFEQFLIPILALGGVAQAFISIQVVKRLHDAGREGKSALFVLVPLIGLAYIPVAASLPADEKENEYGIAPLPKTIYASQADLS
ncbi:MAG: DUF805 domain-containing protein [Balneolales bacterium]|nr:DUF805 domain-containing protein [Balneolales bacterium]